MTFDYRLIDRKTPGRILKRLQDRCNREVETGSLLAWNVPRGGRNRRINSVNEEILNEIIQEEIVEQPVENKLAQCKQRNYTSRTDDIRYSK